MAEMQTGMYVAFTNADGKVFDGTVAHVLPPAALDNTQHNYPLLTIAVNPAVEDARPFLYTRARPKVYADVPHKGHAGRAGYYWEESR